MFQLLKSTQYGRRGRLQTAHGVLETPFFMPVGTAGAMKGLTHEDLLNLGAEILLCNTYHLHLRPGEAVVAEAGGLHDFIGWEKPILTDSGGFQIFSLKELRSVTDDGVSFQSHLDGTPLFLGPREAMEIQHKLGSDIIMCFDQCPPSTAPRAEIEAAVDRTLRWAAECKRVHDSFPRPPSPIGGARGGGLLFGIVQGGLHRDLRKKCAEELIAIGFDGYAVGGLAVGESEEEMYGVLDEVCPLLPEDKPRYLMGVGRIEQMITAVAKGIDMFDCVLPMREARHGTVYLSSLHSGERGLSAPNQISTLGSASLAASRLSAAGSNIDAPIERIRILNNQFVHDHTPIDPHSPSPYSRVYKKSYLNHLMRAGERLGETIACAQNVGVTLEAIRRLRSAIDAASKT